MKDKLQNFALASEIVGAIAIVSSLIFVGVQVNQSNEIMAADARYNRLVVATGSSTIIATNPQLAELIYLVRSNERPLTPAEIIQLRFFSSRILQNMEWSFEEIPLEDLPVARWKEFFRPVTMQLSWARQRHLFNNEFVAFIESNININVKDK